MMCIIGAYHSCWDYFPKSRVITTRVFNLENNGLSTQIKYVRFRYLFVWRRNNALFWHDRYYAIISHMLCTYHVTVHLILDFSTSTPSHPPLHKP